MKNIFIYLFFGVCFFFFGCTAKKSVSEKIVEKSSDTLTYVLPSENNFVISNLCDTLNRPLELIKTIDTGVSETSLEVKDNTLVLQVKTDTVFKDRIQYRDRVETVKEDVVRYKIPTWVWITIIVETLLIIALIRFNKWL